MLVYLCSGDVHNITQKELFVGVIFRKIAHTLKAVTVFPSMFHLFVRYLFLFSFFLQFFDEREVGCQLLRRNNETISTVSLQMNNILSCAFKCKKKKTKTNTKIMKNIKRRKTISRSVTHG